MNTYYILRRQAEFKIIYMDCESADLWTKAGWELRLQDTNENAELAMSEWEASIRRPVPFLVGRQA